MEQTYISPDWYENKQRNEIFLENLAPVVLFVYARLDHTKKTIEALKENYLAENTVLYIYSDAPKNINTSDKVKSIRDYIYTIGGFKKVVIIERESNYGLANNIIDGVTSVVKKHGKVIVLEDDIVTSKSFLKYMNDALVFYRDNNKVMAITSYMYDVNAKSKLPESFFLPWFECWSWATWDRSWKYFKRDPEYLVNNWTKQQKWRMNINGTKNLWNQVLMNYRKEIYTWAIFNVATVLEQNGLVLYSRESLCKNIGFDGSGENCGTSKEEDIDKLSDNYVSLFPKEIEINEIAERKLCEYFTRLKHNNSITSRIVFCMKENGLLRTLDKILLFVWRKIKKIRNNYL